MTNDLNRDQRHRWLVWLLLAAGAVLRGLLIWFPRTFDDDTNAYTELGTNLLHHGVYGLSQDGVIVPSLIRLPGYPIFLGLMGGHLHLALLVQAAIDLLGCWLLYLFAARNISERVGEIVLALSTLCIFTAAYAATGMAESLSIFAVSWGIFSFGELQSSEKNGRQNFSTLLKKVVPLAAATAMAILLRPDGGLLFGAIVIGLIWYGRDRKRRTAITACLFAALALSPLVPWTIRNWRVFHVVQPLASASNPGERVDYGFHRWYRTWAVEFCSTGNIYWNLDSDVFDIEDLPPRAFDSAAQYAQTAALFDEYNEHVTMTPELDGKFGQLADQRIAAHPVRYYVWLPVMRVTDMWLRPRTETFSLDVFWWRWRIHPWQSAAGIALGLLNLGYLAAALGGVVTRRAPYLVLLVSYVVMRSLVLAAMPNSEPRYTLEAYPIVLLCAGAFLGQKRMARSGIAVARQRRDFVSP
jgi:Alg9-like mannosyltransferase family